jgi:stage II sporulation protein D
VADKKSIGAVSDIKVLKRGLSGRALVVQYVGDQGTYTADGATLNRRILGGLKSGLWYVTRVGGHSHGEPSEWVFHGGGYGHGVGLCQHGAIGMAVAGRDYVRILMHYFRKSRLVSLW